MIDATEVTALLAVARTPVESKLLKSHGYDPDTQTLIAEFNNGAIYAYTGVMPALHDELQQALSIGQFFLAHVKSASFACTRLDKETP